MSDALPVADSSRLAARFPGLAARLAPVPLGCWPTPIEDLSGLGGVERLWVKRDDRSAEPYGGSKIRNLEWIFGDAVARGRTRFLTAAAFGSHLVLALAIHARRVGLSVDAVLFPQPIDEEVVTTLRRVHAAGAGVARARTYVDVPPRLLAALARGSGGGWPYWVAAGGASAVGALGYVQAGLELRDQVDAGLLPPPDYVYCAAGSCGTLVGLSEGLALAGLAATVVGVRVVPRVVTSRPRLAWMHGTLRRRLRDLTGERLRHDPRRLVLHDQAGRGYAHETPAALAARDLARSRTLELEGTYTAKALAGLFAFVRTHDLGGKAHLFLDTFDARPPRPDELGELPPAFRDLDAR